jgi:PatG C-terminal
MRIMQMADNAGAMDEYRALNYLAVRYPAIYATTAEAHEQNCSLTSVTVRPSRLTGTRRIVDVIFAYTHRQTSVTEKYFIRVDVTEEFPFLVIRLSPYYDC